MKPTNTMSATMLITLILMASSVLAGDSSSETTKSASSTTAESESSSLSSSESSAVSSSESSTISSSESSSMSSSASSTTSDSSSSSSSSKGMPKITTSASQSNSTYNAASSYTPTFTPIVPTGTNPNIVIPKLPNGTTFVAFGGVLGLIFFGLMFTRVIYWCLSSRNAKKANEMNKVPEFDYDPSLFHDKSLTKHTSRASVYSLGSTSTLNVLGSQASMEQMVAPSGRSFRTALMGNNARNSLFISPTELLATQQLNNFQRLEDSSGYAAFESPIESPYTLNFGHQTTSSIDTDHTKDKKKKPARPPSVYMEQLFDDETSIRSDHDHDDYTYDAHNRV